MMLYLLLVKATKLLIKVDIVATKINQIKASNMYTKDNVWNATIKYISNDISLKMLVMDGISFQKSTADPVLIGSFYSCLTHPLYIFFEFLWATHINFSCT
jgi:hypothetical protein